MRRFAYILAQRTHTFNSIAEKTLDTIVKMNQNERKENARTGLARTARKDGFLWNI